MQQKRSQPTLPHLQDTTSIAVMSLDKQACNSASNTSWTSGIHNLLRVLAFFSCYSCFPLSLHSPGLFKEGNAKRWCTISLANPLLLIGSSLPLYFSSLATTTQSQSPTQCQPDMQHSRAVGRGLLGEVKKWCTAALGWTAHQNNQWRWSKMTTSSWQS